ncbi:unnamed protein product, partial [Heligmosomoides polygyrus]|uniref:Four helix bundle protein n=1 Tax=Heligmosomoides polygyrus TaxID=6339 RepID=A0A183GLR4_HELPZ
MLAKKVNEGNATLSTKLNETFSAVGERLDALPQVAILGQEARSMSITPFSGITEEAAQFSIWLRRLEDIMRLRGAALSNEQKANFLIGYLDGIAREKVEELDEE